MQQRQLVSGFSELKDLLIRTYKIERSRELIKLYFSEFEGELLMHDYDDHKKAVSLSASMKDKNIRIGLTANAHRLIKESLNTVSPVEYLNSNFNLYGFFKF